MSKNCSAQVEECVWFDTQDGICQQMAIHQWYRSCYSDSKSEFISGIWVNE